MSASCSRSPPLTVCSACQLSNGPKPGIVHFMMSASTPSSISGQYTGAPVALATGRHRADVVEMAVGDQDRLDLDAERGRRIEQALRLFAGVDHQRAVCLCVGAHEVGVLLNWADRERTDVDHFEPALPTCLALLATRRLYSQLSV